MREQTLTDALDTTDRFERTFERIERFERTCERAEAFERRVDRVNLRAPVTCGRPNRRARPLPRRRERRPISRRRRAGRSSAPTRGDPDEGDAEPPLAALKGVAG